MIRIMPFFRVLATQSFSSSACSIPPQQDRVLNESIWRANNNEERHFHKNAELLHPKKECSALEEELKESLRRVGGYESRFFIKSELATPRENSNTNEPIRQNNETETSVKPMTFAMDPDFLPQDRV